MFLTSFRDGGHGGRPLRRARCLRIAATCGSRRLLPGGVMDWADNPRCFPTLARSFPKVARALPTLGDVHRIRADAGEPGKIWGVGKSCAVSAPDSMCWPKFALRLFPRFRQTLALSGEFGLDFGQSWRDVGQSWPGFDQLCASLAEFGPRLPKFGAGQIWPSLAQTRQQMCEFDRRGPTRCWTKLAWIRPIFGECVLHAGAATRVC